MYFSILSIPPARAKLFSEAWLILSEKDRFALHSLFFNRQNSLFDVGPARNALKPV
jgi:hypothetical protein